MLCLINRQGYLFQSTWFRPTCRYDAITSDYYSVSDPPYNSPEPREPVRTRVTRRWYPVGCRHAA